MRRSKHHSAEAEPHDYLPFWFITTGVMVAAYLAIVIR
jgi:hypothetical protein